MLREIKTPVSVLFSKLEERFEDLRFAPARTAVTATQPERCELHLPGGSQRQFVGTAQELRKLFTELADSHELSTLVEQKLFCEPSAGYLVLKIPLGRDVTADQKLVKRLHDEAVIFMKAFLQNCLEGGIAERHRNIFPHDNYRVQNPVQIFSDHTEEYKKPHTLHWDPLSSPVFALCYLKNRQTKHTAPILSDLEGCLGGVEETRLGIYPPRIPMKVIARSLEQRARRVLIGPNYMTIIFLHNGRRFLLHGTESGGGGRRYLSRVVIADESYKRLPGNRRLTNPYVPIEWEQNIANDPSQNKREVDYYLARTEELRSQTDK